MNYAVHQPTGGDRLADILERVLDKGIVVAGDITVSLVGIELLSIKVRLIVATVDRAREIGINWWEADPRLTSRSSELSIENEQLKERLAMLEGKEADPMFATRSSELFIENEQLRERLTALERRVASNIRPRKHRARSAVITSGSVT
jgi:regulator of replication initiation timing